MRRLPSFSPRPVAIALSAVIAVALAVWSVSLWRTAHGPDDSYAADRDRVLASAKRQIAVLNTIDAARPDNGLRMWLDISTGPLREELSRTRAANMAKIAKAKSTAQGTVVAAAVTALDQRAGSATVVASVRITLTVPGSATTEQRKRFQAGLDKTPTGWKVKALTAIGVDSR